MIKASETKIWNADIYLRLSKDDRDRNGGSDDSRPARSGDAESNSIKNQREMLLDFVNHNPDIRVVNTLADDGFTGANFERDAFKEMIRHIEDGIVNCVIVKDFSRLGRDHINTGKYIERYFAAKNVRFIAVNEPYDSLKTDMTDSGNSLIVPFKNIINEAFLEDISIKTKSQLEIKRKNGELVCNYAFYGYTKQNGKLAVDDYAADVVKSIFDCKIMGYGEIQIAAMLNAKGVLSPSEYKKAMGISYNTPFLRGEKAAWSANAVKRILTNRVYLGHLEQGKRTKASYRMTQFYFKPREMWNVKENAHEPIINELDFELAQELMAMDTRVAAGSERLRLFSGFIRCGLCGQPMTAQKTKKKSGKIYINYVCSTHKRTGGCQNNNVSELTLSRLVLLAVQQQIDYLLLPEATVSGLTAFALQGRKQSSIESMIEHNLRIIEDNSDYLVKAFKHFTDGIISETEYQMFRKSFNSQIQSAEKNITALREELSRLGDETYAMKMVERFMEHQNITELNRRTVAGLIKSVVVNGSKDINITLRYEADAGLLPEDGASNGAYEKTMEGAVV